MTPAGTVLVDLRAAQFDGDRGIPAYLQSLTAELVCRPEGPRWLLLHDPRRPLPSRAQELAVGAEWRTEAELSQDRSLRIDAILTGCFFLPDHRCGPDYLWPAWLARHQPRRLGIVYDLVPLLFPDRYLAKPRARKQYLDSLRLLRRCDRLFAISHATRRDTIRHAAVDPARIECIYGDIDHRKRALMREPAEASADVPGRSGLHGPYCICIGGDDWRKNMPTAIRAFASFHATHPDHQLAIVCKLSAERVSEIDRLATELGLPAAAVVCTGYVSDADLVGLVRHARLLLYPSLYEGLGLPVLEAYGCGTPAVGSATSSVGELLPPDLACDPTDAEAIAGVMRRLTADSTLRDRSIAFGAKLLEDALGWDRAADRILSALEPVRQPGPAAAQQRVAVAGILPPARTGIAAFTQRYLQSDRWQTTFYDACAEPRLATQTNLRPGSRVRPVETLSTALIRGQHETAIFVLGNSPHHVKVLDALMQTRGLAGRRLAYLHEAALESLFRAWLGSAAEQLPAPPPAPAAAPWIQRAVAAKPDLGRPLLFLAEHAELDGLIVNSVACRDLIHTLLGARSDQWTIDVAFLPIEVGPTPDRPLGDGPLRIGTFGLAGDTKRIDLVTAAVDLLRCRRQVDLVIAGWEAQRHCRRLGLDRLAHVTVLDAPDEANLAAAMQSVDVAVQLRSPTFGESSGVVSELLALGKPVVVTGEGSFAELPATVATFVSADCRPHDIANAIEAAITPANTPAARADAVAAWSPQAYTDRIAEILKIPSLDEKPEPVRLSDLPGAAQVRIAVTQACRDCDPIPKVADAGKIILRNGLPVQIMHDGTLVHAGCYYGDWMSRLIAGLHGHHEPQEETLFHGLLGHVRPGTLFVELGAYWAYYTNWYLGAVPGSRAVCVEPEAANLEIGRRNLVLNHREARMIRAFIGGEYQPIGEGRDVESLDMPAILGRIEAEPIELLHLDIQGAETDFLRSIRRIDADRQVRFIVVSTHHASISGSPTTHEDCLAELRNQGAFILDEHAVEESFSGDGLIVASFQSGDRWLPLPPISRAPKELSRLVWESAGIA